MRCEYREVQEATFAVYVTACDLENSFGFGKQQYKACDLSVSCVNIGTDVVDRPYDIFRGVGVTKVLDRKSEIQGHSR